MAYKLGTIVWYRKTQDDPDITYPGNDPCAATVTAVHDIDPENPTPTADLTIMVDNHTPVLRNNVPLVAEGALRPEGHFAVVRREWAVDPEPEAAPA